MTVINLLSSKKCPHPPTQQLDEIIAWKLHYALFHCRTEYYAGWPASKEGWTVKFLAFAETKFPREKFSACVDHIVRQFDGDNLKLPITKHNISKSKHDALRTNA